MQSVVSADATARVVEGGSAGSPEASTILFYLQHGETTKRKEESEDARDRHSNSVNQHIEQAG
jgi:hypothetical protein